MSRDTTRIMVVYTTETNTTRRVAEKVISGIRSVSGTVVDERLLQSGHEVSRADVAACDGIIIGTPVRHRNMHHRIKIFVEDVIEKLWLYDGMVGMVGATFSVGGGHGDAGAGAEMCQLGVLSTLAANGLFIVPLPKQTPGMDHAGCHWGPAVRTGGPKMEPIWPSASALECAFHHGANVARAVRALKPHRGAIFARGNEAPSKDLTDAFLGGIGAEETAPTAEYLPEPDDNPGYRQHTHDLFPSGDGFERSET